MEQPAPLNRKLLLIVVFSVAWMIGMMGIVYLSYEHKSPVRIEDWSPTAHADK